MYTYEIKLDRVIDGDTIDAYIDLGFDVSVKKRIIFMGINTPESRTRDLELANAKLDRANEELQSRQDLIAKLYSNISSLRFSSDKHAIRNYLNAQFESEKNIIVNQIASQLHLIYALSENNQDWQKYLVNASSPFGIEKEDFSTVEFLYDGTARYFILGGRALTIDSNFASLIKSEKCHESFPTNPNEIWGYKSTFENIFQKAFTI